MHARWQGSCLWAAVSQWLTEKCHTRPHYTLLLLAALYSSHTGPVQAWGIDPGDGSVEGIPTWVEYGKRLEATQRIAALENGFSGESVSLYNGATSFSVTDIDVPGNFELPVRLARRLVVELQVQNNVQLYDSLLHGVGNWEVDVPLMAATYPTSMGWPAQRCSVGSVPDIKMGPGNAFYQAEVWQGINIHVPGRGDATALGVDSSTPMPSTGGPYRLTTVDRDVFDCIPMKSGLPGEGFRMTTAAGVRYYFDVGVSRTAAKLAKSYQPSIDSGQPPIMVYLDRNKYYLLASKIEDRFGNTVQLQYDAGGHPTRIFASDGREIVLAYTDGKLTSATSHGRAWQYQYDSMDNLTVVTLPDASHWLYAYSNSLMAEVPPANQNLISPWCEGTPAIIGEGFTLTATHPSGATASFQFENRRHYRSGVHASECEQITFPLGPFEKPEYALLVPYFFDVMSLTQKTLSGPGMPNGTWKYDYDYGVSLDLLWGSHTEPANYPCTTCRQYKTTTVTNPDGTQRRYRFGMVYKLNDGRLLQAETLRADGSVIRTEVNQYLTEEAAANQPFYPQYGHVLGNVSDPVTARIRPVTTASITEDGATFTSAVNDFDSYARATKKTESSSLGYSRINQATYYDNTNKWVLGQIAQRKVDGTTASSATFDAITALPLTYSAFGKLKQTLIWNADGTIATVKDGNDHVTKASNWKRGIPQTIEHADGTYESAGVDDSGWITWVKDENGNITNYTYDAMGRLASTTYPADGETSWNQTLSSFTPVSSSEYGIPGGHWKKTVHTGNGYTVTYYDALWRPLVTEQYDSTNRAATLSQDIVRYDEVGRTVFKSYLINNLADYTSTNAGIHTSYDALDRPIKVQKDSELGLLVTTTAYLPGFKSEITDPKGNVTANAYMAFDQPTTDWPVSITAAGQITQAITRDPFGSPTSITQSGPYGTESDSVTKTLVYDSYHRLCRFTEPESGSTVLFYDGADNVLWNAEGLAITGTGCGQEQVAAGGQTKRTYDVMNRIKTMSPPAGTQSTSYDYDHAGHLISTVSGISTWQGSYNSRGMLTGESLQLIGQTPWGIGYAYDANGYTSLVHYPGGESVSYSPDALGRPTQAGGYVTGVSYFPDSQVESFTYGNGHSHLVQQNTRQLIRNFSDGMGSTLDLSEDLTYDANGNMTAVNDLTGGLRTKSFGYDALNRLTSAAATNLYGTESYTYDAINNLRTRLMQGQTRTYHYDATNRLTSITQGATSINNFAYNPQGDTVGLNNVTLTFDAKHQLTGLPGVESYSYDAAGRRVVKQPVGGSPTYYFYNQAGRLMYQYTPGTATTSNFIYLGTRLVAQHDHVQLSQPGAIAFGANPTAGSTTISWGGALAATSYTLQQSSNGGSTWSAVYGGSATSMSVSGLAAGGYVYRVQACIGSNCSGWTTSASLGVWPVIPSVSVPGGTINGPYTVSWTTAAGATGYTVQESFNGGAWNTIATNTTATTISRPGTTTGSYAYHVESNNAYGTAGWSATSAAVSVNTAYGVVPAPVPTLSVPATSSTGGATVSWTAASPVTAYTLQQSNNGGSTWATVYSGTATSAGLTGLTNGNYTYHVQACNDTAGNSVCTAWVAGGTLVVTHPPASAPSLSVPASNITGSYTASWGSVATATGYTLQISSNGGSSWSTAYNGSATSWGASGQGNGSYTYRVQACNVGGCGAWSSTSMTTVLHPPRSAPSLNVPASSSTGSYTVNWGGVSMATSYTLQVSIDSGGWSTEQSSSATSWAASGQASGTYGYRVQACNASGCGPWSGTGVINVLLPPGGAPSLSVPGSSTTGSYIVSWGAVATASSYNLREAANGGGWSTVQSGTATSWSASGRSTGSYAYQVQACNASGCGPWSGTGTVSVTLIPATPTGLAATLYVEHITDTNPPSLFYSLAASWSGVTGATSYNFKYCQQSGSCYSKTVATTSIPEFPVIGATTSVAVQACNANVCSAWSASKSPVTVNR